jgi:hypothetical protein
MMPPPNLSSGMSKECESNHHYAHRRSRCITNIKVKAAMGRSKSMNLKEREIHRLRDFLKLSRLKVAPELLD